LLHGEQEAELQGLEAQEGRMEVLLLKLRAHMAVEAALRLVAGLPRLGKAVLKTERDIDAWQLARACPGLLLAA
jgi:uncharacterized protein HemY